MKRELPTAGTDDGMNEATFQGTDLPRILTDLNRGRRTGTLSVTTPTFTKTVYLNRGNPVFASSTHVDDRFGILLLREGKLTLAQYDESVKMLEATGKRHGTILVEQGYLSPQDLVWGIKHQVQSIILSLFRIEGATWSFTEEPIPEDEVITLQMSVANLIYLGVKGMDNLFLLLSELNPDASLMVSDDPLSIFQSIGLEDEDKEILFMLDGEKTVREVIDASPSGVFETVKTLYVLLTTEIVEARAGEEVPAAETISFEDIAGTLTEESPEAIEKVETLFRVLDTLRPHELLEINESATTDTVTENYYWLAKTFHPDRFINAADPGVADKAVAVLGAINKAYQLLRDEKQRIGYFAAL
jgi:hypothetical protein